MSWLKRLFGISDRTSASDIAEEFNRQVEDIKSAGALDNGHYTDSVEKVRQLKKGAKGSRLKYSLFAFAICRSSRS